MKINFLFFFILTFSPFIYPQTFNFGEDEPTSKPTSNNKKKNSPQKKSTTKDTLYSEIGFHDSLEIADSLKSTDSSKSTFQSEKDTSTSLLSSFITPPYNISFVFSYNGLIGTGLHYTKMLSDKLTIDLGFGASSGGFTPGIRLRGYFLDDMPDLFAGFGFSYSLGSLGIYVPLPDRESRKQVRVKSYPVLRAQLVAGMAIYFSESIDFVFSGGYSAAFSKNTWEAHPSALKKSLSQEGSDFFDRFFGSDFSIEFCVARKFQI